MVQSPTGKFCDCEGDGYCQRYRREMVGRMRELCAGVNVDLGTAAAFRAQWAREAVGGVAVTDSATKLLLKTGQAPGDAVAMTAAIYSLHQAHPGKYITSVESYWPDVFVHNPHVHVHLLPDGTCNRLPGAAEVEMHYPAIYQSNERGIHFMQAWCEHLGAALATSVPLLTNRPRLYFSDPPPPVEDYWLICAGGKRDFTNKLWGHSSYQEVVCRLAGRVRFIQVGGARPIIPWSAECAAVQADNHPPLEGVYRNLVNQTTLRDLFDLARRARGILCGVSLLMHVAAAVERPAVVVAGGREPVAWNAYPLQQYVHTDGALHCRDSNGRLGGACWRYRVLPLGDSEPLDRNTCERPVDGIPECMRLIQPATVADLILRYNG